jgi:hypothetical protein
VGTAIGPRPRRQDRPTDKARTILNISILSRGGFLYGNGAAPFFDLSIIWFSCHFGSLILGIGYLILRAKWTSTNAVESH